MASERRAAGKTVSDDAELPFESAFQRYVEHAPVALAITRGPAHALVCANAAFRHLTGESGGTVLGRPLVDVFTDLTGRAASGLTTLLDRAFRERAAARNQLIGPLQEGTTWSCTVWPVPDAEGRPEHLVIEVHDETPTGLTAALKRDVAERLLLGALREHDVADRAEASSLRSGFLAEAGRRLAESLDEEATLRAVAGLALPQLGGWCIVDALEDDGTLPTLRRLGIIHPDPAKQALLRELEGRWSPEPDDPFGIPAARRSARSTVIDTNIDEVLAASAHRPENLRILRELGVGALLTVPLVARGALLGAVTFVSGHRERTYTREDVELAEDLAARCALALDSARLYGQARQARAEAERRARDEEALREATHALNAIFGVQEIIREIAERALEATEADGAFVKRILSAEDQVEVVAVAGEFRPEVGERVPFSDSFTQLVIERGEPIVIPNISEAQRPLPGTLLQRCGDCCAVAVPLLDLGGAIGGLFLLRKPGAPPFGPDETRRAHTFGQLAALAFRKVHLLEDSESKRKELEQLIDSRTILMRGFSHDVRNALAVTQGYLELLEEGILGALSEKQESALGRVRRSVRSAVRLIDDLLDLARAEAGQIEIELDAVDLRDSAREMAEEYRLAADAGGLVLETDLPDHFEIVRSDANRIRQILGNLISNAVKYTPRGGRIVVAVRSTEGETPGPSRWLCVDVSDTGPGIAPEQQEAIFEEFARLTPGAHPGLGLGLAIARRIARLLGGDITVASEVGRGSTFTLSLPSGSVAADD